MAIASKPCVLHSRAVIKGLLHFPELLTGIKIVTADKIIRRLIPSFAYQSLAMKKFCISCLFLVLLAGSVAAQDEDSKGKFRKENLFTGGGISASFSNRYFLVGASPVFGYNLTRWADFGLVFNYSYSSLRDYYYFNDKLRQYVYGGGPFLRLFPIPFLFVHGQFEHNFITQKYLPPNGGPAEKATTSANSFLVGAGYSTNRDPYAKNPFFYMSIMVDVIGDQNSPYVDLVYDQSSGAVSIRKIPVIKAGVQIPLFQGSRDVYKTY